MILRRGPLRPGIVPVLQTPFDPEGRLRLDDLDRLIEDAIAAGAAGLVAPAVASEVEFLTADERRLLIRRVAGTVRGRVPYIAGASSPDAQTARELVRFAAEAGATACLVAVPESLYARPRDVPAFFQAVAAHTNLPIILQDLQWNGPGLSLETLRAVRDAVPALAGVKIETVPAGPKYSAVRNAFGTDLYICGGWAVPQMIEALDRGVDGMVPEASMVRVYCRIYRLHASGDRDAALRLFRQLLPVVAFTNQEIRLSIAFFKALLVRKGIFAYETMRWPGFEWDAPGRRIAEELIDLYLSLESDSPRA
ncbi:MAG: dihydrodipicolinate synthase family protein [Armatimonadota bacterium]|nr:dihydrodipicolinate synthase family protein [Armatimonadota bacterium]